MRNISILSLAIAAVALAPAQTAPPFTVRVTVGGVVTQPADGGLIQFNGEAIGKPIDAQVNVTYRGNGSILFTRVELSGTTDFAVTGIPDPEASVAPNSGFNLNVRFTPSSGNRAQGSVRLAYTETPSGARPVVGSFGLNLNGVAPEWVFTYLPPPAGNATPIQNGGTIAFPATTVNEVASAGVVVTNRGSGAGTVGAIRSTGAAFSLASIPNPPVTVEPNRDVRFAVRYAPTAIETSTGTVSVELVERTVNFNVTGSSTGSVFSYEVGPDGGSAALQPNAAFAVPDVAVGDKSSVVVRVKNTGNAEGRIPVIGIQGAGFTLTDTPFLPAVLQPGQMTAFSVVFTPTQPGRATGRLRIGNDSFDVTSNGLGSNLTFNYVAGPVTTTVAAGGSVIFPPAAVGQTSSVRFVIVNNGTSPTAVSSVGVVATGTTFALGAQPSLPVSIAPGQSTSFVVNFAPAATGALNGTLRVDNNTFTLSGFGNPPPAIPEFRYTGATGAQQPSSQVAVGLSIAQNYPLTLTGTLTLNFSSEVFANDPSVQFAVGGRTVNFTIPAGQRDAVFQNNQTQIRLQTGTVAGAIIMTPTFQSDGGIALTPANPAALTLTVAASAPRLLNVQITGRTAAGFSVLVTGYATSRQISTIDLAFTGASGENVSTTRLSIPADASFTAWYQSGQSIPFGSQFTATIPLTLTGDLTNVSTLSETVKSVSATLTSRAGSSQAMSVDVN